jgi:drug/metabolite transporter (DMT)-like permease
MWILLALLTEALPYLLYTDGLVGMEAGKAAVTVAIEPIVATFVGILFYHETMTLLQGVGTVLVIGAILILNIPAKPKSRN